VFRVLLISSLFFAFVGPAAASQLVDRGAAGVKLAVDTKGEALVTYHAHGKLRRVLVWGAVDANQPSRAQAQVRFRLDYAGGWGKYHRNYWQTFKDDCQPYSGPALSYLVAACTASDGSYWALQSWHVAWPDLGFVPWTPLLADAWLTVSHWRGEPAVLVAHSDWIYSGRFHQLFGSYTYAGQPVYGFGTTAFGAPTDGYGRLVYVDTLDAPAYGFGWRRENSFVAHNPTGVFCYGFYQTDPTRGGYQHPAGYKAPRGPGVGHLYRVSALGPGVTPDVAVLVSDPGDFNPGDQQQVELESSMNALIDSMMAQDHGGCRQH
jgi:hypothetical protein